MNPALALVIAVVLLLANALFVMAEFALLASRRARLLQSAEYGDRRAGVALDAIGHLSLMLAGAQLGITMASLGLGAVAEPAIAHFIEALLGVAHVPEDAQVAIGFSLGLAIVVFVHLVVGEMAPKSIAIADPEKAALALARPFRRFVRLFRPFIRLLNLMSNGVVRLCGVTPQDERAQVHSPAELSLLLAESAEEGTIATAEAAFLERALQLSGRTADDAMTPRPEIVAVPAGAGADVIEAASRRSGRTRLLVHGDGLDDVVGVVHVRDVLRLEPAARSTATAGELARQVLVTTDNRPLEDVLLDLQAQHLRFAVVVDELGAVAGILTMQRVLEALIGGDGDGQKGLGSGPPSAG